MSCNTALWVASLKSRRYVEQVAAYTFVQVRGSQNNKHMKKAAEVFFWSQQSQDHLPGSRVYAEDCQAVAIAEQQKRVEER